MKKNNKGFTLIELLAVIIILIIIIFIAITKVRDSSLKAQLDAIRANAATYVKSINSEASNVNIQQDSPFESGILTVRRVQALGVDVSGTKPDSGYVLMYDYEVSEGCLNYGPYHIEYKQGKVKDPEEGECAFSGELVVEYAYTGKYASFTPKIDGKYKIELWGAQGGLGGNGGYTSGIIELDVNDTLYVYVGGQGPSNGTVTNVGGWNGGGYSGNNGGSYSYGGGGATDVRLVSGAWNNAQSLNSRIMVAAGGGGNISVASTYSVVPGVGGTLVGGNATGTYDGNIPTGATQTGPGYANQAEKKGSFGYARQSNVNGFGGGGGGGYWGGSMGNGHGGSGGSSYISGYTGCVAITSESSSTPKSGCTDETSEYSCSVHYSGLVFTDTDMRSGAETMPSHSGEEEIVGNSGDGYAKITFVAN